jgi:hypothetical protein
MPRFLQRRRCNVGAGGLAAVSISKPCKFVTTNNPKYSTKLLEWKYLYKNIAIHPQKSPPPRKSLIYKEGG